MLATLFQFSGSFLLVVNFLFKNKQAFSDEMKSILKDRMITKNVAFRQQFNRWLIYIGIVEMVAGYFFELIRFDKLNGLSTSEIIVLATILLFVSMLISYLIAKLTCTKLMNYVNENVQNGQMWIGEPNKIG